MTHALLRDWGVADSTLRSPDAPKPAGFTGGQVVVGSVLGSAAAGLALYGIAAAAGAKSARTRRRMGVGDVAAYTAGAAIFGLAAAAGVGIAGAVS